MENDNKLTSFQTHISVIVANKRKMRTISHGSTMEDEKLYIWCLEQVSERYMGTLSQEKIDKLNNINFPWDYYEEELDQLGYDWEKNNPDGVRCNQKTK
jgi:hypothetical protein